VIELADQIAATDVICLACPEYNQGTPGVVKNALDWISRTDSNPWEDKPLAIMHATAGRTGGARANYALRLALAPFNTRLLQGPEILIAGAFKEFDDTGTLTNERYLSSLSVLMKKLRALA
jgi:chromate reductase